MEDKFIEIITPLVLEIHKITRNMNQEAKDVILMTIAGDILHDVSDGQRKKFLENYEELRNSIEERL